MQLSNKEIQKFQNIVLNYFTTSGRGHLPWREKINPYKVWVSEVMLQQTQVDRVIPFFKNWMSHFPNIQTLANASQVEILQHWKGLGYNSRALRMKKCAQVITEQYGGVFPREKSIIETLPGIGPYTAGAIIAFVYNHPTVIIETNIRRVFIHHFFNDREHVTDQEILDLVEKTLPEKDFRTWYWALMDYGSYLGRTLNILGKKYNPNVQSKHYHKQSKFTGSDRQIRGKILEILLQEKNNTITITKLKRGIGELTIDNERVQKILNQLQEENFIIVQGSKIQLKK
jgi:A/G-specific adenine glycosylase